MHDNTIPRFARKYFLSGCVVAFAVFCAYAWAQFPYDNLCESNEKSSMDVSGEYLNVRTLDGAPPFNLTVTASKPVLFCSQSWRDAEGVLPFPPRSAFQPADRHWMSDDQALAVDLLGWTSLICVIMYLLLVFLPQSLRVYVASIFCHVPKYPKSRMINFSSLPDGHAYIPTVKLQDALFPLLACHVDELRHDMMGW